MKIKTTTFNMHKRLLPLTMAATLCLFSQSSYATASDALLVNKTTDPERTVWVPQGDRIASKAELNSDIIPIGDRFITLHGGIRATDEVNIAYAPVFEATWTKETNLYLPEGPSFSADGTMYVSPFFFNQAQGSTSNYLVVALDKDSGERLWDYGPAQLGQGGAPFVLNDPDTGKEVLYAGGYESVIAFDARTGRKLWDTPTNLPLDPEQAGSPINSITAHMFGVSYHPKSDSILVEYGSGVLMAFDRKTGTRLGSFDIKLAPYNAVPSVPSARSPGFTALMAAAQPEFDATFDGPEGESTLSLLNSVLLGNGVIFGNFYGVDPNSDAIYVAGTLNDGHAGDSEPNDGYSEDGALYRINLVREGNSATFSFHCLIPFDGGSSATPSISADGQRIYTADNTTNVLAFDNECNQIWSVDVGAQVFGSLAVSSTAGEIFASNANGVFKLQEDAARTSAVLINNAEISGAFKGEELILPLLEPLARLMTGVLGAEVTPKFGNLNLVGIGENGVMIQTAVGLNMDNGSTNGFFMPLAMTMSLIDRETGKIINSTPAIEETVAVISTSPEGVTAIGNSPFRRVILRAITTQLVDNPEVPAPLREMLNLLVPPYIGGVTKYDVVERFDLLARDATCGAANRLQNTHDNVTTRLGERADKKDVRRLIRQATGALKEASTHGEVTKKTKRKVSNKFRKARNSLRNNNLKRAAKHLTNACAQFN